MINITHLVRPLGDVVAGNDILRCVEHFDSRESVKTATTGVHVAWVKRLTNFDHCFKTHTFDITITWKPNSYKERNRGKRKKRRVESEENCRISRELKIKGIKETKEQLLFFFYTFAFPMFICCWQAKKQTHNHKGEINDTVIERGACFMCLGGADFCMVSPKGMKGERNIKGRIKASLTVVFP